MAKTINQGTLLSMELKEFAKKEVKINANGQDFIVTVDKKFKKTKVTELVQELIKRSDYARKNDIELDASAYVVIMLVKHFTDIEFVEHEDLGQTMDLEVRTLNALINLDVLGQILNVFENEEVNKISETIKEQVELIKKMAEEQK